MSKGNWEQGPWRWGIQPGTREEIEREDPVKCGRVITRWDVPVLRFTWLTFPETLAHHDVFLSLN